MEDENGQDCGISRRKLLGLVGAGAVGGLGTLSSTAQANSTSNTNEIPRIEEVVGERKKALTSTARKTTDFALLRGHFKDVVGCTVNTQKSDVYELPTGTMVIFPLSPTDGVEGLREAELGIFLGEEQASKGRGQIIRGIGDGESEIYAATTEEGSIVTETMDSTQLPTNKEGQITIRRNLECTACIKVAEVICDYGCLASNLVICGLVGLATSVFGSAGCSILVDQICRRIDKPEDCTGYGPQKTCYQIGYCESRPL